MTSEKDTKEAALSTDTETMTEQAVDTNAPLTKSIENTASAFTLEVRDDGIAILTMDVPGESTVSYTHLTLPTN